MPDLNHIFDTRPVEVSPLGGRSLVGALFPNRIHLGRAHGSVASERVAFLIHGLAMNEDYFGLLVPELIAYGYDVWAVRLPGYLATGATPALRDAHIGLSLTYYGCVVASAMAHLAQALRPKPTHILAWGHSLGGAVLASGVAAYVGADWRGPDHLVFEAPAFSEAISFSGRMIAGFSAAPDALLDSLGRALLKDDLQSSEFASQHGLPLVPGRTSRMVLMMNVLALTNPLACTPKLSPDFLEKASFIVGAFDRLVEHDRLVRLMDEWRVASHRRLILPRNHLLSLTSAKEMVEWIERV